MSITAKKKSFIERKRPIDTLRRKLARCSPAAIDMLEKIMKDLSNPANERASAARTLLTMYADILHKDSQDKIKRLEMQLKYKEAMDLLNGTTVPQQEDDDDESPLLDFENITDV